MPVYPTPTLYCLHIEILDSDPPIWRRFWANSQLTLAELHQVLAAVMGWSGEADYRFKALQPEGGSPLELQDSDPSVDRLNLSDLVKTPGNSFLYTYNWALGWIHKITLETPQSPAPDRQISFCLDGEQACPPEFCVGIWGYEELIERLSDPDDPDYDSLWAQVGYDFDPIRFDLKAVNQRLGG